MPPRSRRSRPRRRVLPVLHRALARRLARSCSTSGQGLGSPLTAEPIPRPGTRSGIQGQRVSKQGNRIWSLRLLKAVSTSWGSGAINSDRGCRNAEEPASVRSFARRKGSSAVNHLPDFSYAIALRFRLCRFLHIISVDITIAVTQMVSLTRFVDVLLAQDLK